jgi:hypothetical protein
VKAHTNPAGENFGFVTGLSINYVHDGLDIILISRDILTHNNWHWEQ